MNAAPHRQHSNGSCITDWCWVFSWGRGCGRVMFCWNVAFIWFQFVGFDFKISLWYSCPLFRDKAKFKTRAGVLTYYSIEVLFNFAMKKSLTKSSSTFPRAAFELSSCSRLKKFSIFLFEFLQLYSLVFFRSYFLLFFSSFAPSTASSSYEGTVV